MPIFELGCVWVSVINGSVFIWYKALPHLSCEHTEAPGDEHVRPSSPSHGPVGALWLCRLCHILRPGLLLLTRCHILLSGLLLLTRCHILLSGPASFSLSRYHSPIAFAFLPPAPHLLLGGPDPRHSRKRGCPCTDVEAGPPSWDSDPDRPTGASAPASPPLQLPPGPGGTPSLHSPLTELKRPPRMKIWEGLSFHWPASSQASLPWLKDTGRRPETLAQGKGLCHSRLGTLLCERASSSLPFPLLPKPHRGYAEAQVDCVAQGVCFTTEDPRA
nr:uncharacterized protein LOC129058399 [Pongo abelii]